MENLVGQAYDEPGSWGRLSKSWPSTKVRVKDKTVFLAKLKNPSVPYGSYVIAGAELRISTKKLLIKLNKEFKAAGSPTSDWIMKRYNAAVKRTRGSSKWPQLNRWW